jgi:hypothetical protein
MHSRDASAPERLDGGAVGPCDLASDDAEFGHRFVLPPSVLRLAEMRFATSTS